MTREQKATVVRSALFALGATASGVYAHQAERPGCACEACEACQHAFRLLAGPEPLEPDWDADLTDAADQVELRRELAAVSEKRTLTWAEAKELHAELDRLVYREQDLRERLRALGKKERQRERIPSP